MINVPRPNILTINYLANDSLKTGQSNCRLIFPNDFHSRNRLSTELVRYNRPALLQQKM